MINSYNMKLLQELREVMDFTKAEVVEEFDISLTEYEKLEGGEILDEKSECYLKEYMFQTYMMVAGPIPTNYSITEAHVMMSTLMSGYRIYKNKVFLDWMQAKEPRLYEAYMDEQIQAL